jgi:hypothetical protein
MVSHGRGFVRRLTVNHRVANQRDVHLLAVNRVAESHPVSMVKPMVAIGEHLAIIMRAHPRHVQSRIETIDAVTENAVTISQFISPDRGQAIDFGPQQDFGKRETEHEADHRDA